MRKALVAFISLVFAGCSHSSALSPSIADSRSTDLLPQVWQRGTPPIQWELLPAPKTGLWQNDTYGLTAPLADRENRIWLPAYDYGNEGDITAIFLYNMSASIVGKLGAPNDTRGGPQQLVMDTNGNVWFNWGRLTEFNEGGSVIGDYSDRAVTSIASGVAGDMWYTTDAGGYGYVVRIRSGVFHFFRLPSETADVPSMIAVAGDGTVWFTMNGKLAKLNPSTSQVTVFSFQPATNSLHTGPDGNIWYASNTALERIASPSGAITRFPLPYTALGDILSAPDKTMWLDDRNGSAFGLINITSSGLVLSSATCPAATCNTATGDYMNGLTFGPDQNIWMSFTGSPQAVPYCPCTQDPYEGLVVYLRLSIDAVPASVTFSAPGQTTIIKISESRYSGAWTASSTQSMVVKVVKWLTRNELEIEAVGKGSGRIIIRDANQNYYGENISVN